MRGEELSLSRVSKNSIVERYVVFLLPKNCSFKQIESQFPNIKKTCIFVSRLKSTMLLMLEELTGQQVLTVLIAMEEMESRNAHLIKK